MDPLSARRRRRVLVAAGCASTIALLEVIDTFSGTDSPAFTLAYAALFLVGALATVRRHHWGLVLIVVLLIPEVVFVPFYSRSSIGDWVIQMSVGAVGAVGLVGLVAGAAGGALWRPHPTHPAHR